MVRKKPKTFTGIFQKAFEMEKPRKCKSCGKSFISYGGNKTCMECFMGGK